jgi:hypothetical protein
LSVAASPTSDNVLSERIDNLRLQVDRLAAGLKHSADEQHKIDKEFAVYATRFDEMQKTLNDVRSRRRELWKIILGAILGAGLSFGSIWSNKKLESNAGPIRNATRP